MRANKCRVALALRLGAAGGVWKLMLFLRVKSADASVSCRWVGHLGWAPVAEPGSVPAGQLPCAHTMSLPEHPGLSSLRREQIR